MASRSAPSVDRIVRPLTREVGPRRLPSLMAITIRIAWRAGRRELLALLATQLLGAVAMAAGLLLGKHLPTPRADRRGGDVGQAISAALLLTAATAAIGVTRAFANRHLRLLGEFVILDEPTAALDAQAEEELFAGIREPFLGRSVLLISHRFLTVRRADRIYVPQDGSINELGTHDELLASDGLYARLFNLQAAPYR